MQVTLATLLYEILSVLYLIHKQTLMIPLKTKVNDLFNKCNKTLIISFLKFLIDAIKFSNTVYAAAQERGPCITHFPATSTERIITASEKFFLLLKFC